jgi:hypothetical protein
MATTSIADKSTLSREPSGIPDDVSFTSFDLCASTTAAVKESNFQASFAEQTASEMKQILDFWGSQTAPHPELRKTIMDRNSLDLLDDGIQAHRSAITTSPSKLNSSLIHGKIESLSPTNTLETEMSDSESEVSETVLIQEMEECFCLNEFLLSDEEESPQVSFYPSSEILQQRSQVDFIIRNTERQGSEVEQTLHATMYEMVMVELKHKIPSSSAHDNKLFSSSADTHLLSTENAPETTRNARRLVSKNKLRRFFRYVFLPVVISFFVARRISSSSENTDELQCCRALSPSFPFSKDSSVDIC